MINLTAITFLVSSIQGFLLFLGLISKKSKNKISNIALGLIILVFSIELLFSWGGRSGYNNLPNAFPIWRMLSYLIIPPSLWLFLQANSDIQFKFSRRHLFLFLPAFIEISLTFIPWLISQRFSYQVYTVLLRTKFWYVFTQVLPVIATLLVLFFYGKKLTTIAREYADFDNPKAKIYLRRMSIVFVVMTLFLIMYILIQFFDNFYFQIMEIIEILLIATSFLLGYVAYFNPDFFEIPALTQLKTQFMNYDDTQEVMRLNQVFEYKMLFMRPKLTVAEVAEELHLPVKYVSHLISTYCGNNFNDFVNKFRVKEAIRRINEPSESHKTLLGIALDSGFSSKSTFNQVFKQYTGKTPSEYLP
jgi:AraC-like DNA-binding protein